MVRLMSTELAVTEPPLPAVLSPEDLIARAIDAKLPVDALERLMALREKLQAEKARSEFYTALSAFQGECPVITKDKLVSIQPRDGRAYSYKYAPLDKIVEIVAPLLEKHGFSYRLNTRQGDGSLTVICTLHHRAGHSEDSEMTVPIDKSARMNDTQKVGAARTFCMRYVFCNAVGIMTGDEDTDARDHEKEARDKFKRFRGAQAEPIEGAEPADVAAAGEPDGSGGAGEVESASTGRAGGADRKLSPKDHNALMGAIRDLAAALGQEFDAFRAHVKETVAREMGVATWGDLTPAQYGRLMRSLAAQTADYKPARTPKARRVRA